VALAAPHPFKAVQAQENRSVFDKRTRVVFLTASKRHKATSQERSSIKTNILCSFSDG